MPAAPFLATLSMMAVSTTAWALWVKLLVYAAIIAGSNELVPDLSDQDSGPLKGIDLQQNGSSMSASLPLLYGEVKIGGNDIFIGTAGLNRETLWIVQALSDGECNGIKVDGDGNPLIFINDMQLHEFEAKYGNLVEYTFYSGSSTQVYNQGLVDSFGDVAIWRPFEYSETPNDNYRNTCYILWKFTYDQSAFNSVPKRTVVLEGRKVWLPDGTKAYSNNAAAILYDYLRSPHCAFGLGGVDDQPLVDEIDYFSYLAAYNYCEQSSKGWEFNGAIFNSETTRSVVERLCKCFRGGLRWSDGRVYMTYKDLNEEVPKMILTDEHIACSEDGKAMIGIEQQGLVTTFDVLRVSFINTENNLYAEDFVLIGDVEGVVSDIDLTGFISRDRALAMGAYLYDRVRDPYDRIVSGTFRDDAQQLEIGNIVTLTCSALNYSAKYMRVVSKVSFPSGLVSLQLQLEHVDLYDDIANNVSDEGYLDYDLPVSGEYNPANAPEVIIELDDDDFNSVFEYDLDIKDLNKTIIVTSENDVTVNLPSVGENNIGAWVKFIHYGTGKLTIQAADSDTIDTSSAGGNVYHDDVRDA